MKPISKLRIAIILVVAIVSVAYIMPTFSYYMHQRHRPAPVGERPTVTAPMPDPSEVEAFTQWQADNPEMVAWREENAELVAWEERADELRTHAIPLGLDLLGGVDVTLKLDRAKMIENEVGGVIESIKTELNNEKINAEFVEVDRDPLTGPIYEIRLIDPGDARRAANVLGAFEGRIEGSFDAETLATGPGRIRLNLQTVNSKLEMAVQGAKRGISERIDRLGVTQPRIAIQNEDQIRVQVPGEEDPDRLIDLVIQPAFLEFRLVDQRNNQIIGPDGQMLPDAELPVGTTVVDGEITNQNEETGEFEYTQGQYVVERRTRPGLTGEHLRHAAVFMDPSDLRNPVQVSIEFDNEGAEAFADLTTEYANANRQLAILLDGVVRSAPVINDPIIDGRAVITGNFTNEEAQDLAQILNAGRLDAPLLIEAKRTVGATLGTASILAGFEALGWGALLVAIFMVLYYGTAGVISIVALTLNVTIILAIMAMANATLTMSGIGGILLTIGMAVDANVLIYERIREELRAGRPLKQSIATGFGRAFTVILDSNLTTLLTALVLLQFTEGSVFGFALTMTFGLIANLFTGLTVTYTLCALWFGWRGGLSMGKLAMFKNAKFDFISLRKLSLLLSVIVLVVSIALVAGSGGLKYGVDFAGGFRSEVRFDEPTTTEAVATAVRENSAISDPRVVAVTDAENMFIVESLLVPTEIDTLSDTQYTEKLIRDSLAAVYPGGHEVLLTASFGAQTSRQFTDLAILVVILASIAILIYLSLRFEPAFGVAAIIALVHDLSIVLMLATLWNVQITLEVVAALMVLLGFSVNDTIVIFDRIRENTRSLAGVMFKDICNMSMNQSLARTIVTSGTLIVAVLALFFIGGESLHPFSKVILLGAIVGTYSSNFLATPLVYQWNEYKGNKLQQALAAKKKRKQEAQPVGSAVR